MTSVEAPSRAEWEADIAELVRLDEASRPLDAPQLIPIGDLLVLDSLFQPRGQSLTLAPGPSEKHVAQLTRVVRDGATLDPLAVVAFGSRWVLIDGHHRRAAYLNANYSFPVPVAPQVSDKAGRERVAWAIALSAALNVKDKLPMSTADKSDAAWRLVVMLGYSVSKQDLVDASAVRDRTIGTMRRIMRKLLEEGKDANELCGMSWMRALWEVRRLEGDTSEPDPDIEERKLHLLMLQLAPAITDRLSASLLLEALGRLRSGIELELETAIIMAREQRRASEALDI